MKNAIVTIIMILSCLIIIACNKDAIDARGLEQIELERANESLFRQYDEMINGRQ